MKIKSKIILYADWIGDFLLKQWFFITLAISIVIARFAPNFARHGGIIKGEYSIGYGAVAIIFLQSGLAMKTKDLMINMGNWKAHLTVSIISFLITTSIMFGFCCAIMKANNDNIDAWVLLGLLVTSTCPTTVSSNVIMTEQANGNALLCLCEAFIGNIVGAFISPALIEMYTANQQWSFGNPASANSMKNLYAKVMKKIGLSVFVPLFVGQVLQNIFPKQVKWCLSTFRLNRVSSFCLILVMFSSFSTAFHQHAFISVPPATMIFLVFFILGIYVFFSGLCLLISRPKFIMLIFPEEPTKDSSRIYKWGYTVLRPFYHNRADTIAIVFCGASKTSALGVSLISAQYGENFQYLGRLLVPLVLYNAEQVVITQIMVPLWRKWEKYDHRKNELDEPIC